MMHGSMEHFAKTGGLTEWEVQFAMVTILRARGAMTCTQLFNLVTMVDRRIQAERGKGS